MRRKPSQCFNNALGLREGGWLATSHAIRLKSGALTLWEEIISSAPRFSPYRRVAANRRFAGAHIRPSASLPMPISAY
jgi:hypothetical protein